MTIPAWTPKDQAVEDMAVYGAMAILRKGRKSDCKTPKGQWGELAFTLWHLYQTKTLTRVNE